MINGNFLCNNIIILQPYTRTEPRAKLKVIACTVHCQKFQNQNELMTDDAFDLLYLSCLHRSSNNLLQSKLYLNDINQDPECKCTSMYITHCHMQSIRSFLELTASCQQ